MIFSLSGSTWLRFTSTALIGASIATSGCGGGSSAETLRTVKSYEFASCDSLPTSDPQELAALQAFKTEVQGRYFVKDEGTLLVTNREESLAASGLREYEGPFYLYLHPRKLEPREIERGVEWSSLVYLHAARVRSRANGGDWSDWERVRTRNFGANGMTSDGLGRWKCLLNAEIAWAEVSLRNGQWIVTPHAISVYDASELVRLDPLPTAAQSAGTEAVAPLPLADQAARTEY